MGIEFSSFLPCSSSKNNKITLLVDIMKYGTGSTAVPQSAAGSVLQKSEYNHRTESRMSNKHVPRDPPGTLNTYGSVADSYDYSYGSFYSLGPSYPSVYAQPSLKHHRGHSYGSHGMYISNSDQASRGTWNSQMIPLRKMVNKHPSSPCPRSARTKNSSQQVNAPNDLIEQQQQLLDELDRIDQENNDKKDSESEPSCSSKFGYYIRTAFCQVENLAARRKNNLLKDIGDAARSKALLELELHQQLLDIKKQRQAMEERFEREINKALSDKARREVELQSKLLDQMERRVNLEIELSRTESVESYTVKTTTHVFEERTFKSCAREFEEDTMKASATEREGWKMETSVLVPEVENRSASPALIQTCCSLDEIERQRLATATPKATKNDEQSEMSAESKMPTPVLRACDRVRVKDAEQSSFGRKDSSGSNNDSAHSTLVTSAPKVVMFKPTKGALGQSKVQSKPGRLLQMLLCDPGTLGLEIKEGNDVSSSAIVVRVVADSQGDKAGVIAGDILCHTGSDREFSYHEFLRLAQSGARPLRFNVRRLDAPLLEDAIAKSTDWKKVLTEAEKQLDEVLEKPVSNVVIKAPRLKEADNTSAQTLVEPLPKSVIKKDILHIEVTEQCPSVELDNITIESVIDTSIKPLPEIVVQKDLSEITKSMEQSTTDEVQKKDIIIPEAKPLTKPVSEDVSKSKMKAMSSRKDGKTSTIEKSIEVDIKALSEPTSRGISEIDLLKLVHDSMTKPGPSEVYGTSESSANPRKSRSGMNASIRTSTIRSLTYLEGSDSSKNKHATPEPKILDEAFVKQAVLKAVTDMNQTQVHDKKQVECSEESTRGNDKSERGSEKSNPNKLQRSVKKPSFDVTSALKFLESKALPKAPAPKATKHSSLKPSLAVFADNTRHLKNITTTSNPDTRKIQVEVVKASRKHHAQSTEQRLHSSNLKSEEKESVNQGVPQMVKAEIKVAKKVKDRPVIPNKNKSGSKQRSGKLAKQKVTKPKTTKIAVEDDRVMSKATKPKSKKICKHLPPPLEIGADAQVNDKENAGCKPCLRVQIGLSAPSTKALPFFLLLILICRPIL